MLIDDIIRLFPGKSKRRIRDTGRESRQTYRFPTGTIPVHQIKQNNQPLTGCFVISQIPADPFPAGQYVEAHHADGI